LFTTQKNRIKHSTGEEYDILRELCHYAKNLYNVALYNIRQQYFEKGTLLSYSRNCKACKENENFEMIQAGVAQQTVRKATEGFKSFSALKEKVAKGEYPAKKVRIPQYLEKDGYYQMVLSTNAVIVNDGYLEIPMSKAFRAAHPGRKIKIPFPDRLNWRWVQEVHISPAHGARFFEAEYVSENRRPTEKPSVDPDLIMGIDQGVNNLAACVTTTGIGFLIDGRCLKAANQWYNKERARLQSINDQRGGKGKTRKMACLAINRENFTMDCMRKAARYIINTCIAERIGTLLVGLNKGQKQGINMGHIDNQNYVQIPFWKFRRLLKHLCERYGIVYAETEESYTSKASFLDRDSLPVYGQEGAAECVFSGRRITRGLYRSKKGCINADINGAANIIRKYRPDADFSLLDKAVVLNPCRVKVLNTDRKKPHACPITSTAAAQATA